MMLTAVVHLAQAGVDPVPQLYQYGAIGILAAILLLLSYRLLKQFEATLALERERVKRAEDALATQNEYIRDRVVPALERVTSVMGQTLQASRKGDFDDLTR